MSVVFLKSLSSSVDARKISDTFQYRVKPPFSNPSGFNSVDENQDSLLAMYI